MFKKYRFTRESFKTNFGYNYDVFELINNSYVYCGKMWVKGNNPGYDYLVEEYMNQLIPLPRVVNQ